MKFTLHATTYDWVFLPIAGSTFTDSGTGSVHGAPQAPASSYVLSGTVSTSGGPLAGAAGVCLRRGQRLCLEHRQWR